jgi:hypothetical protein
MGKKVSKKKIGHMGDRSRSQWPVWQVVTENGV